MLTREELARLALAVLDKQKEYFAGRSTAVLQESKKLERELRRECERVLEGNTLFPEDR